MRVLNVLAFSLIISAILFVCIEVPWANTEKWIFTRILGTGKKPKNT
jgi:hypothetical protein